MRVAFVGAGAIARTHSALLADAAGTSVVGVCDPIVERAQARRGRAPRPYADWEAMLDAERLDAVFVCSPPGGHAAAVAGALARGIPVYVEKPLARSLADGLAIVAAWEAAGCVCAVGYQWRSLDVVAAARAALAGARPGCS